jgi:hypothetical protein
VEKYYGEKRMNYFDKPNAYTFTYQDLHGRQVTYSARTEDGATPLDIYEEFCNFLNGVYGWDVRKYFDGDDA